VIDIFNKIRRFSDTVSFEEGKPFKIVLVGKEDKNSSYKKEKMEVGKSYRITVKKYMTEPATSTFDFHSKWNEDKPMPLTVMQGSIEKETRGMYYMSLEEDDNKWSGWVIKSAIKEWKEIEDGRK
jgi:hypothetical protein